MRAKSTGGCSLPATIDSDPHRSPTFPFRSLLHLSLSLCTATSSATRRQGGGKCSCRAGCRSRLPLRNKNTAALRALRITLPCSKPFRPSMARRSSSRQGPLGSALPPCSIHSLCQSHSWLPTVLPPGRARVNAGRSECNAAIRVRAGRVRVVVVAHAETAETLPIASDSQAARWRRRWTVGVNVRPSTRSVRRPHLAFARVVSLDSE